MRIGPLLRRLIDEGLITDPDKPRGRLLAIAARLFNQKGYANTTVRDIAAEAGIQSGSIFHHFSNKEEILFGVMNEVVIAMDAALKQSLSEADTLDKKIRTIISNEVRFVHGTTSSASRVLLYEWRCLSPEKQKDVLKGRSHYYQMWNDILEEAFEKGLIQVEPEYLRQLVHGAIVWTAHWYRKDGKLSIEQLIDRVMLLATSQQSPA